MQATLFKTGHGGSQMKPCPWGGKIYYENVQQGDGWLVRLIHRHTLTIHGHLPAKFSMEE